MAFLVFVTDQCEFGDRDTLVGTYATEAEAKTSYEFHERAYGHAWVMEEEEFKRWTNPPEWTEAQAQAYRDSFDWDADGNGRIKTRH